MSFPTIIAWAWGHPKYAKAAERLRKQCDRFGYDHIIEIDPPEMEAHQAARVTPHMRDRMWTYRFTPGFILDKLEAVDGDVLYLHCDLQIQSEIPVAWEGLDIGLESAWSLDPPRPDAVLAAPIFVADNERSRRFLRLWRAHGMNMDDDRAEHMHLIDVWRYMVKHDRSLEIGTFDPRIASIKADANTPVHGHK